MASFIERTQISNVALETRADISQAKMCENFKNMLDNVTNMFTNEGPIYSTWIRFQIGLDNDKDVIIFDNSSTNPKKNLIAQLEYTKCGSGVTNEFTLTVQYDPFNMGQETADTIEQLDEYVAKAMSAHISDNLSALRGYIQYGYNAVSDTSLVSPRYKFYLTDASTEVRFESGISTYVFKGCSTLAADCDNNTKFGAVTNWRLMDIIEWTLYYWYGTSEHVPAHTGDGKPTDNEYKYKIDIPDAIYDDSPLEISVEAKSGMTPWEYCQELLDKYPLTRSEMESGEYDNLEALSYAQRPRYVMWLDDSTNTIHINHVVPKVEVDDDGNVSGVAETSLLAINHTFTWGTQSQNIVLGWKPEVNTMIYLIRKARTMRAEKELADINESGNEEAIKSSKERLVEVNDDLNELYDAQLQILGIPSDIPLGVEIKVCPKILETMSRTAGVYVTNGATDVISSNGFFSTTLKLYRIRNLDVQTVTFDIPPIDTNEQAQQDNKNVGLEVENTIEISKTEIDVPGQPSGGTYA